MYQILADVLKYIFVVAVYAFLYSVIKLVYLDISDTRRFSRTLDDAYCYLKLINLREDFNFKIFESYGIREDSTIGRSKKCEIYIPDPYLSKRHARIFLKDGAYYLMDLGSTNGTYLNGQPVGDMPVRVKDSDKVRFGTIHFLFVDIVGLKDGDAV